jgi:peptidoglycan hydrolase CwlO-like protein
MKRSMFFFVLLACMFGSAFAVTAQTPARPTSEQSLQELVTEVRQLRATLQRMNVAVYKGQVLLERLKLQQEDMTRISRELAETRESIYSARAEHFKLKEHVRLLKEGTESGVRHSNELATANSELEEVIQRQERLIARETRLAAELETARTALQDLNHKLNFLVDMEMAPK